MSSLHKSGLREKKGEVGFVSAPGRRRMPNERHHTDSCIVHFLATETSRDRFVSLSLQKEHSFLTKSSERTPNKPEGLRSRRRFLIFVLQIQIYGLCLSITLKKNKTKQNNNNKKKTKQNKTKKKKNKTNEMICITAVNRLAPCHVKTPYHTADI